MLSGRATTRRGKRVTTFTSRIELQVPWVMARTLFNTLDSAFHVCGGTEEFSPQLRNHLYT